MKKFLMLVFLVFLFITPNLWGQHEECKQFKNAIEYVKLNYIDKNYKKRVKFNIYNDVQQTLGIPYLISEFYAYQMDVPIIEFQKLSNFIRDSIYQMNSNHLQKIDSTYSTNCFQFDNYRRPRIKIHFTRINTTALGGWIVNIHRNPRKHIDGRYLILLFDNNNQIIQAFETSWME